MGFRDPSRKTPAEKNIQFLGTNVSRSLMGTQLVTKRVMSLHPHNPQFWSKVNPPNITIPAPRCGGSVAGPCQGPLARGLLISSWGYLVPGPRYLPWYWDVPGCTGYHGFIIVTIHRALKGPYRSEGVDTKISPKILIFALYGRWGALVGRKILPRDVRAFSRPGKAILTKRK